MKCRGIEAVCCLFNPRGVNDPSLPAALAAELK